MYLLGFDYQNAGLNGSGRFSIKKSSDSISKWTVLDADALSLELLRLLLISCIGSAHLTRIPFAVANLCKSGTEWLLTKNLRVLHDLSDRNHGGNGNPVVTGGVQIDASGKICRIAKAQTGINSRDAQLRNPYNRPSPGRDFILAYGDDFSVHNGDDVFDFSDPFFHTRRYHSLFSSSVSLTDPVAFLERLFYCGAKYKKRGSLQILDRICRLMGEHGIRDVRHWLKKPSSAAHEWKSISDSFHRPLTMLMDAARHVLCAFPKMGSPLDLPGVILLHHPDRYCSDSFFPVFMMLLDEFFPNMQFVITVPNKKQHLIPGGLLEMRLPLPHRREEWPIRPKERKNCDVLLIDVDSRMPNLALMKLSRYFKEKGIKVELTRDVNRIGSARKIFASSVFSSRISADNVRKLKNLYGDSLQLGGSGVDIQKRLPEEIEALPPDYECYPELGDRAIGFLSRGCPMHCPFCIVPIKEGKPRQVSDLETLLEKGRRTKLILLDDNFLSLPHADRILEEMAHRNLMVNFTQTLDLRYVDRNLAALLRRIRCSNTRFTRSNYHFSINDCRHLDLVREKYEMFGFSSRDNVEFVSMYGFNTTLAEDLERFRFLRSLPGAYVFTQLYQPIPGGPPPDIDYFFEGGDPDRLITELIKIHFAQNMKSMEKYYRWLSRKDAEHFGKLHMPLVDTIFLYNHRHLKGRYMETMAGLKRSV